MLLKCFEYDVPTELNMDVKDVKRGWGAGAGGRMGNFMKLSTNCIRIQH